MEIAKETETVTLEAALKSARAALKHASTCSCVEYDYQDCEGGALVVKTMELLDRLVDIPSVTVDPSSVR